MITLFIFLVLCSASGSNEPTLVIFRPFNSSLLYNSPELCRVVDLTSNHDSPEQKDSVMTKLDNAIKMYSGPFCPFLIYRKNSSQFIHDIMSKHSHSFSVSFIVNDTVSGDKIVLAKNPIILLSLSTFTADFYKKVRFKDLTGNFIEFQAKPESHHISPIVRVLAINAIVYCVFLISLITIYARKKQLSLKYLKSLEGNASSSKKIWLFLSAVVMIAFGVGVLILLFFFYDIFVYFFVAIFMIQTIASGVFFTDFIGKLILRDRAIFLTKGIFWNMNLLKMAASLFFLLVSIFWLLIRRYNPVGPIVEIILGIQILSFVLSLDVQSMSFKSSTYLFVYLLIYDVVMVYISPYWNLSSKVAGPFTSLAEVSIMENVASGLNGLSGENIPLLFRVQFDYLSPELLLGYGDVIIPGLMITALAFYDYLWEMKWPFHSTFALIGYEIGLIVCMFIASYFRSGQPALLFICPSVWLCVVLMTILMNKTILKEQQYSLKSLWRKQILEAPLMRTYSQVPTTNGS